MRTRSLFSRQWSVNVCLGTADALDLVSRHMLVFCHDTCMLFFAQENSSTSSSGGPDSSAESEHLLG